MSSPNSSSPRPPLGRSLTKLGAVVIAAGVLIAGFLFPATGAIALATAGSEATLVASGEEMDNRDVPTVTTMTDRDGNPIAYLYDQRRFEVGPEEISDWMKLAIISVEDHRFLEHNGVDWQGTARAFFTNTVSGQVEQGASTLEQQYIKNYQLLVLAETDAERRAAIETSYTRKLREIRLALALDKSLTKEEILTRYLNIVPFGNGAFGIQAAAQTYFGIDAIDLNLEQSAMLAGMVQSSSTLNPYTNEEAVINRRNTVLGTMVNSGAIDQATADQTFTTPLGVLDEPDTLPRGCIAAGDRGFFCEYALDYLRQAGVTAEDLNRGGYTIRTTLDPAAQDALRDSLAAQTSSTATGAAAVGTLISPTAETHEVVAMGSSREFGLELGAGQTVQPQPWSLVGNGAGSIFKVFAAAVALDKGMGLQAQLDVPRRYEATGLGVGGARNCPPNTYCVENAANYASRMTLQDALAQSPNTTFIKLIEDVGVPETVDMAVRLGMRSYTTDGSFDGTSSIADYVSENNLGSFVLGPTPVNGLELANVGATLADNGRWCQPMPVLSVTDRHGTEIELPDAVCDQAISPELAHAVAQGLSKDSTSGTAAAAASSSGWSGPMAGKTGTTESHQSAAFLGFSGNLAGAVYAYNDSPQTTPLCTSPLRQCSWGDLYGGSEPARIWFGAATRIIGNYGGPSLPDAESRYIQGTLAARLPNVIGMSEAAARSTLASAGYRASSVAATQTGRAQGIVTGMSDPSSVLPGGVVVLQVSDGSAAPRNEDEEEDEDTGGDSPAPAVIQIPGLPPITLPPGPR